MCVTEHLLVPKRGQIHNPYIDMQMCVYPGKVNCEMHLREVPILHITFITVS